MKRFVLLLVSLLMFSSSLSCLADGEDFWDEPMKIDEAAKNQERAVTDQEFEKVMKLFEKKKKKKQEKNKPKGAPLAPPTVEGEAPSDSNSFKVTYEDYPTVMIPVTLITQDHKEIPPGYYRILSVKKNNEYFLNFYQGNTLVAKVEAVETGNDHNQKSLNYAKVIPVNDKYMDVIYGDIDCNIEAIVNIKY